MSHHLALALDRRSLMDSPIHRLDARGKLVALLLYLVTLSSLPPTAVVEMVPLLLPPTVVVIVGRVPLRLAGRAMFLALPLALAIGLPNVFLDRRTVLGPGGIHLSLGWLSCASLALRAMLSVLAVVALTATTPLPRLIAGLRGLGLPQVFVDQLHLMYRYLFILGEEAARLLAARSLRQPQRRRPDLATAKQLLLSLVRRTWERSARLHQAMLCRGFRGSLPMASPDRWHRMDTVAVAVLVIWCVSVRWSPPVVWLGQRVLEVWR